MGNLTGKGRECALCFGLFLLNLLFRPVIMVGCLFFAQAAINA